MRFFGVPAGVPVGCGSWLAFALAEPADFCGVFTTDSSASATGGSDSLGAGEFKFEGAVSQELFEGAGEGAGEVWKR